MQKSKSISSVLSSQNSSMSNICPLDSEKSISNNQIQLNAPMLKSPFKGYSASEKTNLHISNQSQANFYHLFSKKPIQKKDSKIEGNQIISNITPKAEENLTVLTFCSHKLSVLPTLVTKMKNSVQEINLSQNFFQTIPIEITQVTNLKCLNMSGNHISNIPNYVFQLTTLEILDLRNNEIKFIPQFISKLKNLSELFLCYNYIEQLIPEIFNLPLTKLGIKCNLFFELPYNFRSLLDFLQIFELEWFTYNFASPPIQDIVLLKYQPQIKDQLVKLSVKNLKQKESIKFDKFVEAISEEEFNFKNINQKGQTILFNFIHQESLGAIKLISKQYPDISYRSDNDGLYPITYCYAIKKIRCFPILLQYYESNCDILNTLMLVAVKKLDLQVLKLLIEKGIDINYTSKGDISGPLFGLNSKTKINKGSNALHCIMTVFGRNQSQQESASIIAQLLLEQGADPNQKNEDKLPSLHVAIKLPSLSAVKWAASYNKSAALNAKIFNFNKRAGPQKDSPLHLSANLGLVSIMQTIQQVEADPFLLNKLNKSPKFVSISSLQVIKLMRKYELFYIKSRIISQGHQVEEKEQQYKKLFIYIFRCQRSLSPYIEQAMISKNGPQSDRNSKNDEESIVCKQKTFVKHQISNQETDLLNEECQENANVSIKSPFQTFVPNHMKMSNKKNGFKLNFSKLNHSNSLNASSHSQRSLQRKQFEELNDLYKEVQKILRKSNNCSLIVGDLLKLLKPVVVNDISRQKIEVALSDRNFPIKESFNNDLITVATQKLIITSIINMVLFKARKPVTFTSYIMSSAVMILNQVNLEGVGSELEIHQLRDIINQCQRLREYSGKVNRMPLKEMKDESNTQIQDLKTNLSQNLLFDIINYWPQDAPEIEENLNENILTQLGLYYTPYSQTNFSFSYNRISILGFEQSHQALLMKTKFKKSSFEHQQGLQQHRQLRIKSPEVSSNTISISREMYIYYINYLIRQTSRVESEQKHGIQSDRLFDNKQTVFSTKLKLRASQQDFLKAQNEMKLKNQSNLPQPAHFKFETPRTNLKNYSALQEKIKQATRIGYISKKKGEKALSNQTSRNYVPNENVSDDEEIGSIQDIHIQLVQMK